MPVSNLRAVLAIFIGLAAHIALWLFGVLLVSGFLLLFLERRRYGRPRLSGNGPGKQKRRLPTLAGRKISQKMAGTTAREGRMPSTLHDLSFEQLAAALELREDSQAHLAAKAEITVRQLRALLEAAEAQKRAADSQERPAQASASTASAGQRTSHWILTFHVM